METRAVNGMHLAQNNRHTRWQDMLDAIKPNGMAKVLHTEMFVDRSGKYLDTYGASNADNVYGRLRAHGSRMFILVRLYHPQWWTLDPVEYAKHYAELLGKWRYLDQTADLLLDPYVGIVPANEQNIEYPGMPAIGWRQFSGATQEEREGKSRAAYQRIAEWHHTFSDSLDAERPDRKALLVWSAFAAGHDCVKGIPDSEYQIPEVRAAILRCDVANTHPYAIWKEGSPGDNGPGQRNAYWGMLRDYRPKGYDGAHDPGGFLAQFPGMPYVHGETGTFSHNLRHRTEDNIRAFRALYAAAVDTGRCLGAAPFIWDGEDGHKENVLRHNPDLQTLLYAMPYYQKDITWPSAMVGRGFAGRDSVDMGYRGDRLAAILSGTAGAAFTDMRRKYEGAYRYADSSAFPYIVIHHTTGTRSTTLDAIYAEHVNARGWPGIGYHIIIRQGKIYLISDPDRERAHIWGRNREGVGIAVTGNYKYQTPAQEDIAALRIVVAALDKLYGHKKTLAGHGSIALSGHGTECPGTHLSPYISTLRNGSTGASDIEAAVRSHLEREHEASGLRVNTEASLWRAAAGGASLYLPTTNEIEVRVGSTIVIAQRYEHSKDPQRVRYYWCYKEPPYTARYFSR